MPACRAHRAWRHGVVQGCVLLLIATGEQHMDSPAASARQSAVHTIQVCAPDCDVSCWPQQLGPSISRDPVAVIQIVHRQSINTQQRWAAAILVHQVLQVLSHCLYCAACTMTVAACNWVSGSGSLSTAASTAGLQRHAASMWACSLHATCL